MSLKNLEREEVKGLTNTPTLSKCPLLNHRPDAGLSYVRDWSPVSPLALSLQTWQGIKVSLLTSVTLAQPPDLKPQQAGPVFLLDQWRVGRNNPCQKKNSFFLAVSA
jgi:hypothetical protein